MSNLEMTKVEGYKISADNSGPMVLNTELGPKYNLEFQSGIPYILAVGTAVGQGSSQASPTQDVAVTAQQTINAYHAVGYDGLLTQETIESLSKYAGVSRFAFISGETEFVVRTGLITDSGFNWTPDAPVFITGLGVLTQTVPTGPVRRIGWALSATQLNLDPFPVIGV